MTDESVAVAAPDYEVPAEIKKALLTQEIAMYQNSLYIAGIRARVNRRIGNEEAAKATATEMEKLEQALDLLKDELTTLE